MQKFICLVLLFLITTTVSGKLKKIETEHFQVKYESETEKYVLASLKVLEMSRTIAVNNGFILPDKIKFFVIRTERNVLYFDKKSLDKITWEYNDLSNFLPPNESKKKNVYGLCHELGHICMYSITTNKNNWMTYDYRESWADFFGNTLIDSIYHHLGTDFWPEPHNFKETAGIDFMLNRINENKPEMIGFNKSSQFWYELNTKIGFENINAFFRQLKIQKVNNPNAKEKYLNVLVTFQNGIETNDWFNNYSDYIIFNKN